MNKNNRREKIDPFPFLDSFDYNFCVFNEMTILHSDSFIIAIKHKCINNLQIETNN